MNPQIRQIVGKTIASVIVSDMNAGGPPTQVFLIFDDDTSYELYGDIYATSGLRDGGEAAVLKYAANFKGRITQFGVDDCPASLPDLTNPPRFSNSHCHSAEQRDRTCRSTRPPYRSES